MTKINFNVKDNEKTNFNLDVKGTIKVYPPLDNLEITPSKERQTFKNSKNYGYDSITIDPIPEKYIVPTGMLSIKKNGVNDVTKYNKVMVNVEYNAPEIKLQTKEVTPTKETQTITNDGEYDGLNSVKVNPIPDEYIIPNGTLEINENGVTDVTEYKNVNVNVVSDIVEIDLQEKEVTPTKETQEVRADIEYDGLGKVKVNPIPDEYIIPDGTLEINENGETDVTMFRMARVGVHTAPTLQDKEITITENTTEIITPDEGYDGLNQVNITVNVENATPPEDEPEVEPNYITDGLVAWWEGCDNVDSNERWNSRVGSDYISQTFDKVINSPGSINDFHLYKTKDGYINAMSWNLSTQQDYYKQGYTIEVVGKVKSTITPDSTVASSSGGSLITFNKSCSPMVQVYGSKGIFFPLNWNSGRIEQELPKVYRNCLGKLYKYTINLDTIVARGTTYGPCTILYSLNGDDWNVRSADLVNMSNTTPNMLIMAYYSQKYQSNGEVKSIRVYNRKLTHEELVHNYQIDKARFKLDEYTE